MHPLDGVWLKVRRGRHHMNEAKRLIRAFRKTQPYSIRVDMDLETGDKLWKVDGRVKTVPLRLGAIVGDAIYNFRSALDHLAWQLVEANGEVPTDKTAFPICVRPDQWPRAQARLKGMCDGAKALIKAEQPCFTTHRYRRRDFTWLEELCNVDKHRHLHLIQAATVGGLFSQALPTIAQTEIFIFEGTVESNTVLARFPKAYAYVDFLPAVEVSFGEGSAIGQSVYLTLVHFGYLVESTIKLFDNFFPVSTTPKLHRFDS